MPHYPSDASLRDARAQFFALAGFDSGGYDDRWVRLRAGPFSFKFPNTAARGDCCSFRRKTYHAFIRGRRSANLYTTVFREELLDRKVGEMRDELSIHSVVPPASVADRVMFIFWSIIAVAATLAPCAVVLAAVALLLIRE